MANRISQKVYRDGAGAETKHPDGNTIYVVIKFANGQDVIIDMTELSPDILNASAAHGIAQKVGDNFAEAKGDINLAHGLAQSMARRLEGGEWNVRGEGGASASLVAMALAEHTGKELADCITHIAGLTKEERKELRDHPAIALIILRIETERKEAKLAALRAAAENAPAIDI